MMDKLKFALLSIVVLFVLGLIGYWAVATLQTGTEFKTNQQVDQLQKENEDLKKQVADLTDQLSSSQAKVDSTAIAVSQDSTSSTSTSTSASKYQSLIDQLQKLVDGNVSMKLKSSGSRVGTVQNFLNIYNKTSNKVDNDYGAGTQKAVMAFQKDQGLSADGQAGKSTFTAMISWLKKQG